MALVFFPGILLVRAQPSMKLLRSFAMVFLSFLPIAKERSNFIEGCARTNKIPGKKANAIFDLLEKFAGYGFNKSHSAAYGVISYQTAYLKAHYPVEFMAGLFSNEINNTHKISVFVRECKRMGISILPPDI